jgi:hypothetical protein
MPTKSKDLKDGCLLLLLGGGGVRWACQPLSLSVLRTGAGTRPFLVTPEVHYFCWNSLTNNTRELMRQRSAIRCQNVVLGEVGIEGKAWHGSQKSPNPAPPSSSECCTHIAAIRNHKTDVLKRLCIRYTSYSPSPCSVRREVHPTSNRTIDWC